MLCPQISMSLSSHFSCNIFCVLFDHNISKSSQPHPSYLLYSYFMVHIHSLKLAICLFIVIYLFPLNPKLRSSLQYLCHPRQCPALSRGSVHACWIPDLSWSQSTSPSSALTVLHSKHSHMEASYTGGGTVSWCSHHGKQCGGASKN